MDELDRKILAILAENARISMRDLGKAISLSNTATTERVRRLEESGVIRGYRAEINRALVGDAVHAFIIIAFKHELRLRDQAFWAYINRSPHICATYPILTGGYDYMLELYCPDMEALVAVQQSLYEFGGTTTYMSEVGGRT